MKFSIGSLMVNVDTSQLFQGHGLTVHINGEIAPNLSLAVEVSYLPVSTEKLNVIIKVNQTGGDDSNA